jgi:hypothetical protein
MTKRWVAVCEGHLGFGGFAALEQHVNDALSQEGAKFDGIEFHVVGDQLVATVMFTSDEEDSDGSKEDSDKEESLHLQG